MTITLDLPEAVEHTIEEHAKMRGMAVPDYVLVVLMRGVGSENTIRERNSRALKILRSRDNPSEADIAEQKETWDFLQKALQEDRLSFRRVPPEEISL